MLPPIHAVVGAEMIRDGGSLAAEFMGANGSRYSLHFSLISEPNAAGDRVRLGYEKPIVFERLEFRQEGRVDWQSINEVEVSWAHAKVLLHQMHGLMRNDEDKKWLEAMEQVADAEGQLPDHVPPVLKPARAAVGA